MVFCWIQHKYYQCPKTTNRSSTDGYHLITKNFFFLIIATGFTVYGISRIVNINKDLRYEQFMILTPYCNPRLYYITPLSCFLPPSECNYNVACFNSYICSLCGNSIKDLSSTEPQEGLNIKCVPVSPDRL